MALPRPVLPPLELRRDAVPVRPEGGARGPGGPARRTRILQRACERDRPRGGRGPLVPHDGPRPRPQRPRVRQRPRRILSPNAYLISNGQKVTPGTDGAISVLGEVCALAAAVYTALVGWLVLGVLAPVVGATATIPANSLLILIPVAVGFLGCQIDSVLGATLERKGIIGKRSVNLVSTSLGGIIAYGLLVAASAV
ncbi:MAG: DUF92 domain-containing protein [Methanobacteriota archaeon]|nr:MAG: DUF92 domain-containing protein [Euryarchaeota archaeon]